MLMMAPDRGRAGHPHFLNPTSTACKRWTFFLN